jgi:hypothetical protein
MKQSQPKTGAAICDGIQRVGAQLSDWEVRRRDLGLNPDHSSTVSSINSSKVTPGARAENGVEK